MTDLNRASLWSLTTVTDLAAGDVLIYTPVNENGGTDLARTAMFKGRAQLSMPGMPQMIPLVFDLPGPALPDALSGFAAARDVAARNMQDQIKGAITRQRILAGAHKPNAKQ
jgi:hypothetical protein